MKYNMINILLVLVVGAIPKSISAQSYDELIDEYIKKNSAIAAKYLEHDAYIKLENSVSAFSPPIFSADYMNMPLCV